MKSRTTLILVVVALVISGVVVLDFYKGTPTEDARAKRKRLLDFEAADVTGMDLVRSNQTIILEKSGDRWDIKQPLAVRADSSAVRSILDELEFAERQRALTEAELADTKPADFGLESPRIQITLRSKKPPVTLSVGSVTPAKNALYAQVQGQKEVLVTRTAVAEQLDRSLTELRDRTVVDISPSSVTRLEIKSADRVLELVKSSPSTNAEPRWAISRPLAARADQSKVSQLLTDLSTMRVENFLSDDAKDVHTYRLDEPEREVAVWATRADTSRTLLLGHTLTNDLTRVSAKLKGSDSIFSVPAGTAQKFNLQVNDLRDARVLGFSETDVYGLELLRGTEKLSLARDPALGGMWRIIAPAPEEGVPAEETIVRELLSKLQGLTAKQFTADVAADLDKFGLAAPQLTVTLQGQATNVLGQLLIGSLGESNGVRYVKRADEPFVYGIEPNILDEIPVSYLGLRTRRLAPLRAEQINSLTIQKPAGQTVLSRASDGTWRLVVPSQGALDVEGVRRLVETFCSLRAKEFMHEDRDNPAVYGLDQPQLTFTGFVGEKPYTLVIGKQRDNGQTFALWSEPPLLLTLSASDVAALLGDVVATVSPPVTSPATNVSPAAPAPPAVEVVTPPVAVPLLTNAPSTNTVSPPTPSAPAE